jgi:O-methyltransferase
MPLPPFNAQLYLDLMKRVLTDSIFLDDPLAHYVLHRVDPGTVWPKRLVLRALSRFLSRYRMNLVESSGIAHATERAVARECGTDWPARAHTMIGMKRLNNLQFCVESVIQNGVPGDLIETGVWRGGACIFMRAILKAYGDVSRNVWLADSFAGLPPPDSDKYSADIDDKFYTFKALQVSETEVRENFRRYDLLERPLLKGLVQRYPANRPHISACNFTAGRRHV